MTAPHKEDAGMTGHRPVWLAGKRDTHFLQFANARITREAFPLGGFIYAVTSSWPQEATLYTGSDYEAARATLAKASP